MALALVYSSPAQALSCSAGDTAVWPRSGTVPSNVAWVVEGTVAVEAALSGTRDGEIFLQLQTSELPELLHRIPLRVTYRTGGAGNAQLVVRPAEPLPVSSGPYRMFARSKAQE